VCGAEHGLGGDASPGVMESPHKLLENAEQVACAHHVGRPLIDPAFPVNTALPHM